MSRAFLIPVAGAVAAPLITWFPMLAHRFPWMGLPPYPAAQGIDLWSSQAFYLSACAVIALIVGTEDKWLGLAVLLAGLTIFWRGATLDPTHSILFTLGALMLYAMRRTPRSWTPRIKSILVCMGVFEAFYVLHQWAGYDTLWGPLFGGNLLPKLQPLGTLGTVDATGAYLAITGPLMVWWLLPLIGLAVWHGHSVGAILALAAGLAVRYRHSKAVLIPMLAGLGVMGWYSAFYKSVAPVSAHMTGRGAIWAFGLKDWITTDPIIGYGLGGWQQRIPQLQVKQNFAPTTELWRETHNEYLQWLCEAGLIGLVLLVMWMWTHRQMFTHPVWGGSITALGVSSITFFPLHVVAISLMAIILVGLATAPQAQTAHPPPEWGTEQGD